MENRPTVLLADDHAMVAQGLGRLLEDAFDLVGTVGDGRALVEAARNLRPDVIVTDISMPEMSGLDAVRTLRREGISTHIVVLTMHDDRHLAAEAYRAGASGYLLKQAAGEELVAAVRAVLAGRLYLPVGMAPDLIATLVTDGEKTGHSGERSGSGAVATSGGMPASRLTPRQLEVLHLIARGCSAKEIARSLAISARTAESHKYAIMQEMGVQTTAELILSAVKQRLIEV